MIQFKNLDLWYICTNNPGMQKELMRECHYRREAYKYITIAKHTAQLEHEMQQMWEQELMCD
jgi:hypothetical protein